LKENIQWYGQIDKLMGYDEGEFPRTLSGWAALVHPDDLEHVKLAIDNHLKNSTLYNPEYRVRRKDGNYMHWSAKGSTLRNTNDIPYSWVGSITNITKRKKAELDLKVSNEKLKDFNARLERSVKELETFNKMAVGRENRMIELKRKINTLSMELGKEKPYDLSFAEIDTIENKEAE
jgi:PAS domain S-box-containing protein